MARPGSAGTQSRPLPRTGRTAPAPARLRRRPDPGLGLRSGADHLAPGRAHSMKAERKTRPRRTATLSRRRYADIAEPDMAEPDMAETNMPATDEPETLSPF